MAVVHEPLDSLEKEKRGRKRRESTRKETGGRQESMTWRKGIRGNVRGKERISEKW